MQSDLSLQPTITLPVAGLISLLALADGGFSPQSVGVATAAVWLVLAGAVLGGRLQLADLRGPLAAGAALLALIAAWTAISISWASDEGAAFEDLVRNLMYLGAFLLVGLAARQGTGPSWLAGMALGGAAVALIAVLARLAGLGVDQSLAVEIPAAAERLSFPLGYWNALGYLMAMTLVALGWVAVHLRGPYDRAAAAASLPVVVALFLTSSRGALLAAMIGLLLLGWASDRRSRLWQLAVVAVPAWVALIVIVALFRSDLDPSGGLTLAGAAIATIMIVACALIYTLLAGSPGAGGGLRRRLDAHSRPILVAVGVVAVGVAIVAGPSSFIGDFRTERGSGQISSTTDALVSGSGRSDFWGAALSAFGDDPLRGVGAGGFENYWNANGAIAVPVQNAHSAPLEILAELGVVGGAALLGLVAVALIGLVRSARLSRRGHRGMLGAFAGIGAAGLVAVSLDWTWQVTAAAAPLMVAVAVACSPSLRPDRRGREVLAPRRAMQDPGSQPAPGRTALAGALLAGATLLALWAGSVLALTAVQLDRGEGRLAEGDLTGAADAALAASRLQPWSPEPSLLLASIEQAGTNLQAARRRAEEAARLAPDDFRPWTLLMAIHGDLGNVTISRSYAARAQQTGGAVLEEPTFFLGR